MRYIIRILLFFLSAPAMADSERLEPRFAVAGVPVSLAKQNNLKDAFDQLRRNNVALFFPTFLYQEVPEPKSLGLELAFTKHCRPGDPHIEALKNSGLRLILPGELLYPVPERIGQKPDPLAAVIECMGREHIFAITNYDEPLKNGRSLEDVMRFYRHVKARVPDLPVLGVFAPVLTDTLEGSSPERKAAHFQNLRRYGAAADIVGFDVYPIPPQLAKIAGPLRDPAPADPAGIVGDYTRWLAAALPEKRRLMVLQAFNLRDLFHPDTLAAHLSQSQIADIPSPTFDDQRAMLDAVREGGVALVIWWGASTIPPERLHIWHDLLAATRTASP